MWQRYERSKIYVLSTHRCQHFTIVVILRKFLPPERASDVFFVFSHRKSFFLYFTLPEEYLKQKSKQQTNHEIILSGSPLKKSLLFSFLSTSLPIFRVFFFLRLNLWINVETPENPYESDQKSFDLKHSSMNSKWCCFCYVFFFSFRAQISM